MSLPQAKSWTRRRFLGGLTLAGAVGFLGLPPRRVGAEPPPEIQKIRLVKMPAICLAPVYLAEELLRLEGFSAIEYVEPDQNAGADLLMANRTDIGIYAPTTLLPAVDTGKPGVVLAGIHGGCYELFAHERVRTIGDLKGKRVAVSALNTTEYYFIAVMAAYVGVNPHKDIHWVDAKSNDGMMQLFIDGQVDAVLAFPPQPQDLRAKKVGRVIVDTAQDRPWEQYFCCMVGARKEFVTKHPIATKRVVRAFLKAADICAREPERAARYIVAKGYEARYDLSLEVIKSLSYGRWRTHDPEDSLRFYGVRLHEVGMIKTNPQKLIAQGTDWRFLNELKKELKG